MKFAQNFAQIFNLEFFAKFGANFGGVAGAMGPCFLFDMVVDTRTQNTAITLKRSVVVTTAS